MRPVEEGTPIDDIFRPGVVLSTCTCGGGEFVTPEIYVASRFDLSILFFSVPTGDGDRCQQRGDYWGRYIPLKTNNFPDWKITINFFGWITSSNGLVMFQPVMLLQTGVFSYEFPMSQSHDTS